MVEFDFDSAWFGDIKANTLENHRKLLEVLYENLLIDGQRHGPRRRVRRGPVRRASTSTLRKVLRATAPTSKGMQILLKRPTAKHRKRGKFLGRKKSPIEEKLWVEWPVIERATAALYKKVKRDPKKATDHDLTDLLMLGLYVYADPRRNDYHNMKMGRGHQEDTNYCDLVGRTFVFNDYKTSKFYKQQNIAIQPRLVRSSGGTTTGTAMRIGGADLPIDESIHRPDEGDHKAPVRETSLSRIPGRSTSRSRTRPVARDAPESEEHGPQLPAEFEYIRV